MGTFFNKQDLINQAKELGAVSYITKSVANQFGYKVDNILFSTHFFNIDNKEVAYLVDSEYIYQTQGLKIHNTPKEWPADLISQLAISGKTDINTNKLIEL